MQTELEGLGTLLVFIVLIAGLVGTFVPVLPGALLIWLGILFYAAVVVGFSVFSPWVFGLITLIALVAVTAELWLPVLGASSTGASGRDILVGFLGAIAGTFLIPVPVLGTIIGYGAGLLLSGYIRVRDWRQTLKATFGGVVGWGLSSAVELVGGIAMIALFFTQVP
jgi:uncharacterized protein YqgC (DUF456 family)